MEKMKILYWFSLDRFNDYFTQTFLNVILQVYLYIV
jgi:hypothetical protein